MTVEQLQEIAIWQDAQIQHQHQYLNEKKSSKHSQHHLLLNACNKLSELQTKVTFFPIFRSY